MRDYNLRSRDIYGAPKQPRRLGWLKILVALLIAGAAAVYFLDREGSHEIAPSAAPTSPNIIPLTIPPRGSTPTGTQ